MAKNAKIIIGAIIAVIVVGGIWYGVGRKPAPTETEKETIKIGAILPLSGKAASIGDDTKKAIDLALDKLNQENEIKLEVIYEDEKCDPKEAVSAYQSLSFRGVKIFIGAVCSPSTLAIAPLAEKNKDFMITPGSGADTISDAGDYIFRNHTIVSQRSAKLAEFVGKKFNSAATLYDQTNDGYIIGEKVFAEKFQENNGSVLIRESYQKGATDFRTELIKIKNQAPQVLYLAALMPESSLIVGQIKNLGLSLQIVAEDALATDNSFLTGVGDLSDGIIFAGSEFNRDTNPSFWDLYTKRYDKNPNIYAAQGYDSLMLIAEVIKQKCKKADTSCVKDEFYKIENYTGVSGLTSFDKNGDASKPIVVKTIKNGQFMLYEE